MSARRVLTALGLVAFLGAGSVLSAAPAGANTVVGTDPAGDALGAGDIRALRLSEASGARILFQVRTERPLNIVTSPAWTKKQSLTVLRVNVDVNGGAIDNVIYLRPGPSGAVAEMETIAHGPSPRASCTNVSQPEPTLIRVSMYLPCVDSGTTIRAFARYVLDQGGNGTVDSDDRAPNNSFGPPLVKN